MTPSMKNGMRWSSVARYVARRGWMHLVLLSGTAIFLFPFVWVIATSVKTDEELAGPNWWPQIPAFRAESPYARPAIRIVRPAIVEEATWNADLPALTQAAVEAVEDRLRHGLLVHVLREGRAGARARREDEEEGSERASHRSFNLGFE